MAKERPRIDETMFFAALWASTADTVIISSVSFSSSYMTDRLWSCDQHYCALLTASLHSHWNNCLSLPRNTIGIEPPTIAHSSE